MTLPHTFSLATGFVIFLIYTNALVVAKNFHGVPAAAVMLGPMLLGLPIAHAFLIRKEPLRLTPALPWIILFVFAGFIGSIHAARPMVSLNSLIEQLAMGVMLFLLVANAIRTRDDLERASWGLLFGAAFMGAIVLHQKLTGSFDANYGGFAQIGGEIKTEAGMHTVTLDEGPKDSRQAGPIGEVNRFAQIMALSLPFALAKFSSEARFIPKMLAAVCGVLGLAGCVLSFSRGVMVGLLPFFALTLVMGFVKLRHALFVGTLALSLVVAVPSYRERLASIGEIAAAALSGGNGMRSTDSSARGRLTELMTTAMVFFDHPIVGAGAAMNPFHYTEYARKIGGKIDGEQRQAHSFVPHIAAEFGIVGLLGMLGTMGVLMLSCARTFRRARGRDPRLANLAAAGLMAIVVYLGTGVFLHASYVRYLWLILGLAAAAASLSPQPQTYSPGSALRRSTGNVLAQGTPLRGTPS